MKKIMIFISLYTFSFFPWGEQSFAHVDSQLSRQKTINIKDYFIANQYPLNPAIEGIEGKIELLQDKAFKNWKNPGSRKEGNFQMGENYAKNFEPALLRLRNKEGRIVETINLKSVWYDPIWINLGKEDLYGTGRTSYFVQQDNEIGSGIAQGTYCRYFDVVKGHIVWLKSKDRKTGRIHSIDLNLNMLCVWKSVPSPNGKGKVILQRFAEYSRKNRHGITHYERYEFNGHEWIKYEKIVHEAVDSETELSGIEAFH